MYYYNTPKRQFAPPTINDGDSPSQVTSGPPLCQLRGPVTVTQSGHPRQAVTDGRTTCIVLLAVSCAIQTLPKTVTTDLGGVFWSCPPRPVRSRHAQPGHVQFCQIVVASAPKAHPGFFLWSVQWLWCPLPGNILPTAVHF